MLKVVAIGAMIAALAHPATADRAASDDPPTAAPRVILEYSNGNGCPSNNVSFGYRPATSSVHFTFGENIAAVGLGTPPVNSRRTCQVAFVLRPPEGYQYTIASTEYRGHVTIAAGASATYRAAGYFRGHAVPTALRHTAVGPVQESVSFSVVADPATPVWAPCGEELTHYLNMDTRVSAGTSDVQRTWSSAAVDEAVAAVRWRRC